MASQRVSVGSSLFLRRSLGGERPYRAGATSTLSTSLNSIVPLDKRLDLRLDKAIGEGARRLGLTSLATKFEVQEQQKEALKTDGQQ